ncbi:poly-gamma-glutamate synthesis protein (capsule biosynthesis protein) [Paenibacillus forsythiae]|uniref:Poly-gamma-glutamate synthesis protein (Capsule biosynthesis protein) n=1 Tax=Paenibacillus forsythiae TaxID=365616 RepID=A0ABU3H2T6_9BACL|nr:CapA family protein [Paenibacillus forsythiae]MDT3425134.1 poly-gamma-glutamate synthesis protein (capsule biosynthesis protein) [Paenibacillus forsythiae]
MRKCSAIIIVIMLVLYAQEGTGAAASAPNQASASDRVSLVFAGDILLDGYVGDQIAKYGVNYPFLKVAPVLKTADVAFANLETPVSTRGQAADKTFAFRSRPGTLAGLNYAGIDGVTVANNHILDYGQTAMLDTLSFLDKYGIGRTGAGKDMDEAFKPYTRYVKGKKIAVLGVSRVLSDPSWYAGRNKPGAASAYSTEPLLGKIRQAAKASDFTVVYIHWNQEFKDYPLQASRQLARQMIDSGADLIIGSHSHCLMGVEYYKHKPVYYSLGNFVFNRSSRGGEKTLDSMLANFQISGDKLSASITPVKIMRGQPVFMDANYNKKIIQTLNKLSYNAFVDSKGNVSEKNTSVK